MKPDIGYYRVSTKKQGQSGLGLEAQQATVAHFVSGQLAAFYTETESGKNAKHNPQLTLALAHCRLIGARLVIAKLDRLSRDPVFTMQLQRSDVEFVCCDMPNANRLTIGIMALVAEQEREAGISRTKAGLQAAKARGTVLGGYKGGPVPDGMLGAIANRKAADDFAARVLPVILPLREAGVGLQEIARRLMDQGVVTVRGGAWDATRVRNLLARV